jgi:hypothetical protein
MTRGRGEDGACLSGHVSLSSYEEIVTGINAY